MEQVEIAIIWAGFYAEILLHTSLTSFEVLTSEINRYTNDSPWFMVESAGPVAVKINSEWMVFNLMQL